MSIVGDFIQGVLGVGQAVSDNYWNSKNYALALDTQEFNEKAWQASYDFGVKQFEYQQGENDLTREREDNAIQRRVADLQAAGLSPTLAAGSAAGAAAVHSAGSVPTSNITPARRERTDITAVINALTMSRNLSRLDKEIEVMEADRREKDARTLESMARSQGLTYSNQAAAYANALMDQRWDMEKGRYAREGTSVNSAIREADARIEASSAAAALSTQNLVESQYNMSHYKDYGIPTNAPAAVKNVTTSTSAAKQLWDKFSSSALGMQLFSDVSGADKKWIESLRKRGFSDEEIKESYNTMKRYRR